MNIAWLNKLSESRYFLAIPLATAGLIIGIDLFAYFISDDGIIVQLMSPPNIVGTLLLYAILPSYMLGAMAVSYRRSIDALRQLEVYASQTTAVALKQALQRVHPLVYLFLLVGFVFGVSSNSDPIVSIWNSESYTGFDVAFILSNCLVWVSISLFLTWRIPAAIALSRFGGSLKLDLFRLDQLKPLTRVATTDILIVAGAMAVMPLQALDAEFRWVNYRDGTVVGILSALAMFIIPLLGLRRNLAESKEAKLILLRRQLSDLDKDNLQELEALLSHIDRVKGISTWPVDLQLITRVSATLIIPPLAWVAAALVENMVNTL